MDNGLFWESGEKIYVLGQEKISLSEDNFFFIAHFAKRAKFKVKSLFQQV